MAALTIELPEELAAELGRQATEAGFAHTGDYVIALLQADTKPKPTTRQEIEEKLLKALDSGPATPVTHADWDELRRAVKERGAELRRVGS